MRILAVLLALVALPAFGQGSASLSCTPPTTNTNGTPITGAISYRFYEGPSATSQTNASPAQTSCAYTWPNLIAGTHFFSATATVAGVESARSNVVSKVIDPAEPNPPGNLVVVSSVAMETRIRKGELVVWREAGPVEPGTACDPEVRIEGTDYYAVPRDSVTQIRPHELSPIVVALCAAT